MTNCVKIGWSSPSRLRIVGDLLGLALSPAMIAAGSPGVSRSMRKTRTATISITGMVAASRRRT